MPTRRDLGLAAAAALLARPALAQGARGGIVMAQQAQPPSLDAQVTTARASRNIKLHIYETLFARDEAGNPQPDLAEGVDVSADGLTYRFALRAARFHNGKPMTAADVRASLLRYGRVGGSAFIMQPVEAIETPDARTVVARLKQPSPGSIAAISSPRAPCAIIPEEEAGKEASRIEIIGTGPYRFVEYRPDSHVRLARFADYVPNTRYQGMHRFAGRKVANIETIRIRFVPEAGARTAGLQTGEIHILEALAVPAAQRLRNDRGLQMHEMMPWAFQTLMLNHALPPMGNPAFRRAVQAALDLEEIMAISTDGLYRMAHGWQHPGTTYCAGDVGRPPYNINNRDRARALLRAHPSFRLGLLLFGAIALCGLFAAWLAPHEPLRNDFHTRLQPPSELFWFGTDRFGRDILSGTLHGIRVSLRIGLGVALLTALAGGLIGAAAGFWRRLDGPLMRLMDALMAFPAVLLAIALAAALGPSELNVILALSIACAPRTARVMRAGVLVVREFPFVEGARAIGASPLRVLVRHVLPNAWRRWWCSRPSSSRWRCWPRRC